MIEIELVEQRGTLHEFRVIGKDPESGKEIDLKATYVLSRKGADKFETDPDMDDLNLSNTCQHLIRNAVKKTALEYDKK